MRYRKVRWPAADLKFRFRVRVRFSFLGSVRGRGRGRFWLGPGTRLDPMFLQ